MSTFIMYSRLNQKQATKAYKDLTAWFTKNPRRRVCNTEFGKIRKGRLKEDLLMRSQDNVRL